MNPLVVLRDKLVAGSVFVGGEVPREWTLMRTKHNRRELLRTMGHVADAITRSIIHIENGIDEDIDRSIDTIDAGGENKDG